MSGLERVLEGNMQLSLKKRRRGPGRLIYSLQSVYELPVSVHPQCTLLGSVFLKVYTNALYSAHILLQLFVFTANYCYFEIRHV